MQRQVEVVVSRILRTGILTNHATTTARATITDGYAHNPPATYRIAPGGHAEHTANPDRSNHWYDLSISSDHDPGYQHRLAGHVETGRPSTSDPAIAAH
jgi:phospholipase C